MWLQIKKRIWKTKMKTKEQLEIKERLERLEYNERLLHIFMGIISIIILGGITIMLFVSHYY